MATIAVAWVVGLALALVTYAAVPHRFTATSIVHCASGSAQGPAAANGAEAVSLSARLLERLSASEVVGPSVDAVQPDRILTPGKLAEAHAGAPGSKRLLAIAAVREGLRVDPAGPDGMLRVHYTGMRRTLAPEILNTLVERAVETSTLPSATAVQPVVSAAPPPDQPAGPPPPSPASVDPDVEAARRALAQQQLRLLTATVAAAQSDLQAADAALASAQITRTGQGPADSSKLAALRAQRAELTTSLNEMAQRYGPLHPEMIARHRQLDELTDRIAQQERMAGLLAGADDDARTRLTRLQASLELAKALATSYDTAATAAAAPTAAPKPARAPVRAAPSRPRSKLDSTDDHLAVRLVAAATLPPPVTSGGVLFAGLSGAAGAAAVAAMSLRSRRKTDPGLRTEAEVTQALGPHAVALVPEIVGEAGPAATATADAMGGALAMILDGLGADARTAAICSAVSGEGKTTTSVHLARCAATRGLSVVLVDCDGRRGALSKLYPESREPGLLQVLRGESTLDQALIRDERFGIGIIRHSASAAVADLSDATGLQRLLALLQPRFDLVLLDTGPVLALAEARVIAALADSVLLVARWGHTPVGATRLALDMLVRAGAKVRVVALTRAGATAA